MPIPASPPFLVHVEGACEHGDPECNGIATLQVDPYQEDIYGEQVLMWLCPGARQSRIEDI